MPAFYMRTSPLFLPPRCAPAKIHWRTSSSAAATPTTILPSSVAATLTPRLDIESGKFQIEGVNWSHPNSVIWQVPELRLDREWHVCGLRELFLWRLPGAPLSNVKKSTQIIVSGPAQCRRSLIIFREFITKFGEQAFYTYYLPMHEKYGQRHLPGLKFLWETE
ncbi:hypothetical protein C8R46DRAFT_1032055 [Mycena filopes]|nr:hypothetical protein C8R46DRAFT_1032055 [Mycena filopes]